MNIYRWILFPILSAVLLSFTLTICLIAIGFPMVGFAIVLGFIVGGLMGLVLQFYNEYQTRKVLPQASENDFEVDQIKQFAVFYDFNETFDLCLEFIKQYPKAKLKNSNPSEGLIEAKTRMGWNSNGSNFRLKIKKITENTTEIEISTNPKLPGSFADCGEGLKIIRNLQEFTEQKNYQKTHNLLTEESEIPVGVYFNEVNNVRVKSK